MRDATIVELTEVLRTLAQEGGKQEVTSIDLNVEIVNANPTDLPQGYMTVRTKSGHYMPAVKASGVTYTAGEKINLINVKGTEPTALHPGTGSSFGAVRVSRTLFDPTGSENVYVMYTNVELTLQEIRIVLKGSSTPSLTVDPYYTSDRSAAGTDILASPTAITNTTTGHSITSFASGTLPAGSFLIFETTAVSGVVDEVGFTFRFG